MRISVLLFFSFLFFFTGIPFSGFTNNPVPQFPLSPTRQPTSLRFIENKNQWNKKIYFKLELPGGTAFFERNGVRYVFYDQQKHEQIHDLMHSAKSQTQPSDFMLPKHSYFVKFVGALENIKPKGYDACSEFSNYFIGNDSSHWASDVKSYGKIIYHELYPGIDLIFTEKDNTLKYEFIVKSGGNPGNIKFLYNFPGKIYLENNELKIITSVNEVTEKKPFAYTLSGEKITSIACNYFLNDSLLSFKFPGGFNSTETLVIDPVIVFSTYSGSTADNWGYTATYDNNGSLYAGGIAFAQGYDVTLGAFQTTFGGGGCDISITKFTPDGKNLVYSTYLGGSDTDQPHSMFVTSSGELTLFGTTGSNNFPVSPSAFQGVFNGGFNTSTSSSLVFSSGSDLFVTKFSTDGKSLVGSTYFGGSHNDGLNISGSLEYNYGDNARGEIIADNLGNSYIATCTYSSNIPGTAGTFQPAKNGNNLDALVFCLNQNLSSLVYCSYLGGGADDAAYGLRLDTLGNLFVSGGTNSSSFPGVTGGLNGSYLGGQADGFISKINPDFTSLIQSTYLGTAVYDQSFFVDLDEDGFVYTFGQTVGSYPVSSGVYSNTNGRHFVHKISADLKNTIFSTVFGSGGSEINISPSAFMVDQCKNIYLSGWGGNVNTRGTTTGMSVTGNAFQSTTDGSDFYFMVLSENAENLYYATYFGGPSPRGEHVDGGTSRFDPKGLIYQAVCAGCGNTDLFPTTPGVWSNTNESNNCNLGAIKFDLYYLSANIIISPLPTGCAPFNVQLSNNAPQGLIYKWDLGDNTSDSTFSVTHTYTKDGNYEIVLVVTDTAACSFSDTATANIQVYKTPVPNAGKDTAICQGDTVLLNGSATDATKYQWSPNNFISDNTLPVTNAYPSNTTNYILWAYNNNCSASDTVLLSVLPDVTLLINNDTTICKGTVLKLSASGASNYLWKPGKIFNDSTLANPEWTADTSRFIIVSATSPGSCTRTDTIKINVNPVPNLTIPKDTAICNADTIQLSVQTNGVISWSPGKFLSDSTIPNPVVFPDTNISYILKSINDSGCSTTGTLNISVMANPDVFTGFDQWICSIDSVKLVAQGAEKYNWLPATGLSKTNVNNPSALPAKSTLYLVTGINNNGCSDTDSVWVFIDSIIPVDAGTDKTVCSGFSTIIGGNPTAPDGVTILWNPDSTLSIKNIQNPVASPKTATKYVVTVSSNKCSVKDSMSVTINAGPVASFTSSPVCLLDTMQLSENSTISSGTIVQRKWFFGDGDSSLTQNPTHIFKKGESDTIMLVVVSDKSCTDTIKNKIELFPLPDLTGSVQENITCFGNCNGKITVIPINGKSPYSYSWQGGQSVSQLTGLCPGLQSIVVTDDNQCRSLMNFNITEPSLLEVTNQRSDAVCLGDCNGIIELSVTGGTTPYSYSWSDTNLSPDSLQISLCPGVYFFTVTDANGCNKNGLDSIKNKKTLPVAEIKTDRDSIFQTESIKLQATLRPGYSYHWEPSEWINDANSPYASATPPKSSIIRLTVTDEAGCLNFDSLFIYVKEVICAEPYIYIPNAFSPNNDNKNDILYVRGNTINELYFAVFDSWGTKVFDTTDKLNGWDGKINGSTATSGVYVYYMRAGCVNGEKFTKKGNVTLLR